jgi:O-Antigen ligase
MNSTLSLPRKVHSGETTDWSSADSGWGWQRIILLLMLLQSIGIRALPLQGVQIGVIICLFLAPRIRLALWHAIIFIVFTVVFIIMSMRGMSSYTGLPYIILILCESLFFVRYVEGRWAAVEYDLLTLTWWLSLHGLLSYGAYKIVPSLFSTVAVGIMQYKLLGFFILFTSEPSRATGLCWEPGLLQYVANISLFLGIKRSWPLWRVVVSFLTVVITFSTTGIISLVPTMCYLLFVRRRTFRQWMSISVVFAVILVLGVSIFQANIQDKLGGRNTSGLIRLRDFRVGIELIKQKPLLGHGQFDEKYLLAQSDIWAIATNLFSKQFLASTGEFGGGYTNGFLGFIAGYGLLLGTLFYWLAFENQIVQGDSKGRWTFFLITVITFMSEPITNTSWFFTLVISGIYSRQLQGKKTVCTEKLWRSDTTA